MQSGSVLQVIEISQRTDVEIDPDLMMLMVDASVVDVFIFNSTNGMDPGYEYSIRARAHTFTTEYFSLESSWSATGTFYSSDLPETIASETFINATKISKTEVTVSWELLSSDSAKGYSTTDPVYTLQVDLCGR